MEDKHITIEATTAYAARLRRAERSPGTIENYLRHARTFACWLDGAPVTKERAAGWKEYLLGEGYAPVSINAMLAAVNGLFSFLGWHECKVKFLKVQRQVFRDPARELTRTEYDRLLSAAQAQGQERLALLMEAICATGIRVSEVKYLTVEAARKGRADISLKGKVRTILLPSAAPGILTGIILAVGRIVGESAALLFTAGSGFQLPRGIFSKLFESSGTLTIQLYLSMQKAQYDQAFGIAVVLLVIVLCINLLARFVTVKFGTNKK